MYLRRFSLMLLAASVLAHQGCCSSCRRGACGPPCQQPVRPIVPPVSPLPPRFAPAPAPAGFAPAPYPPASPAPFAPTPAPVTPPPAPPSVQGSYSIPIPPEPAWKPSTDPGVRLSPPEAIAKELPREPVPVTPPMPAATPTPTPPSNERAQSPEPPRAAPPVMPKEPEGTPPLPVDIPQFALAKPRVAAGQQPFPDGVAWLQANGYRTVLYIRRPGEDETAARRQFEKRNLRYLSIEVAPMSLTKEIVDQFNRTVADEPNLPLFVYDRDGSLAGGLWYLHFRLVENATDEKARTEAARLGFKEDRDNEHRTMWIAVQNFIQMNMK